MVQLDVFIIVLSQMVVRNKMRFTDLLETINISRMQGDCRRRIFQDLGEVLLFRKCHHDTEVVTPSEIADELVDSRMVERLASPDLTFEHQDVPLVDVEVNIRLAFIAECLASRFATKNRVQVDK